MARRALAALLLCAALPAAGAEYRVVVHPENPTGALPRAQLAQLFLKKVGRWPDGVTVQPVEPADRRLRERFAAEVLRKSPTALRAYWNQLIFSGRDVPPLERPSDAEVVAFVRATRGAVGYVGTGADVAGVKVVDLTD